MNERVVEILIYIMKEMQEADDGLGELDVLSAELEQKGYTENEIKSALAWLLDKMGETNNNEIVQNSGTILAGSFRVLHEVERMIISPSAFGYLIQLRELGLIDDMDLERMLERALMLGSSYVKLDDMKTLVASSLFHLEAPFEGPNNHVSHFFKIH
ncbi:DUF494 family protein [bacterium]|nr:DUF494 family protein [bacterium]